MRELVAYIAKALVDNPDKVEVTEIENDSSSVIEVTVAREDLGQIIGRQGRTARAIRTVLGVAATKQRRDAVLEIVD